jgi:hypothetical protein
MKTLKKLLVFTFFLLLLTAFSDATLSNDLNSDPAPPQVGLAGPPIHFGQIITGKNSQYHEQPAGSFRQDLSGAATDNTNIIFVDDGGSPPDFSFVRVMQQLPDDNAVNLPLTQNHQDLEGATYYQDFFVATGSLSDVDVHPDARWLTRFKLDQTGSQLIDETSVDLRDQLLAALQAHFGQEWFDRIKDLAGRDGGLNIEGLSRAHTGQDVLLWGLRSPLWGDNFPADLRDGAAIIAKVYQPFGAEPTFQFETLDLQTELGNHGIRAMEWIPKLHGYVIIGGPVQKANDYSLWRLRPNGALERIELPGFDQLCRPESVLQLTADGKDYLVVLSEESGAACDNVAFTFIQAEILPGESDAAD